MYFLQCPPSCDLSIRLLLLWDEHWHWFLLKHPRITHWMRTRWFAPTVLNWYNFTLGQWLLGLETFSHLIEWRKDMKTKIQKDTDQKESLILCCQGDVAMFHKDTFSRPMAKKLRNLYRVKTIDFVPCMVKICCVNLCNLYIHSRNVFMWVSLSGMFDESINSWSYSSTQSPILDLTEILLKLGLNFHIWHTFRALPELIRRECHNL